MSNTNALPEIICIMGPTAAGKTDHAIKLAQESPCDIISVDSAMVYRGMDIGTAKPTAAELVKAPHRLIDICDPSESYSAGQFYEDAQREIKAILAKGRTPILVGGTMLYFRALQQGIANLPEADPAIREKLQAQLKEVGLAVLHKRLADVDPQAAARINPNDPQRTLRALEVFEQTGTPLTELWQAHAQAPLPYTFKNIVLAPEDRAELHARIAKRFDQMLAAGFVDEVRALYERGDLTADMPSMRAVGYRQAWDFLAGKLSHDEMRERAIIATRQFAKRQYTWLRGGGF